MAVITNPGNSPLGDNQVLKFVRSALSILCALPVLALATEPILLATNTYKPELGVLIIQVNWGRSWKCGQFENAQLQALTFTKSPIEDTTPLSLDLETPSKLLVDNKYLPYAFVVQPGEYVLTGFDVKVARSAVDVSHIKASKDHLLKDGKPTGGTFTVGAGEAVYVGHFGLDCGAEPFLWRNYLESREDFEKYVRGFREKFPFMKPVPVQYRLFSTQLFGRPFSLPNPTVN